MSDTSQANKRIAKNTLVIYGQLILKLFLGLYTSRLILEALGVSDFGLYSVVGGVVGLFTFISESLSGTTIRFINVERGKSDGDLNKVFNVCNLLHIAMAIFLFLLLEAGGVYYIHHYLNVDPGKGSDAMFVFQISTLMCFLGVANVPYASLFNATEKFVFTTVVDISMRIVRLLFLFWLLYYEGNRVRVYALIETMTTLTPFVVYHYYAYRRWPTVVRWRFVRKVQIYREMIVFASFNLMSTFAMMMRGQGSMLLINYFFGTRVNGAFAIAKTIERNLWPFASNFQNAATPQITQSYSSGDMERVFYLASRIGKYCMLMMMLVFFPLWAELDFILHLWLVKVPEGAVVFCRMFLILMFFGITDGGISRVVDASGKIGRFRTSYSLLILMCIPVSFLFLKYGSPAYMLLVVFLVADVFWRLAQLYMMHKILHFPVREYCLSAYLPVVFACIPIVLFLFLSSSIILKTPMWHIGHMIFISLLTVLSVCYLGLRKNERERVFTLLSHHLGR